MISTTWTRVTRLDLVTALLTVLLIASFANGVHAEVAGARIRFELPMALVVIAVVTWLCRRCRHSLTMPDPRLAVAAAAWLLLELLASIVRSPDKLNSAFLLVNLMVGVAVYVVVAATTQRVKLTLITVGTWVLSSVSTVSIVTLVLLPSNRVLLSNPSIGSTPLISGLASEPNLWAQICVAWVALLIVYRRQTTPLLLWLLVPILTSAILTNTRAAWITLVPILAVVVYINRRNYKRLAVGAGLLVIAAAITIPFIVAGRDVRGSVGWKVFNLLNGGTGTGAFRLQTDQVALNDLRSPLDWLFGLGTNSFGQRHPTNILGSADGYLANLWSGLIYDSGLLGLLAFLTLVFFIMARSSLRAFAWLPVVVVLFCATFTNPMWLVFPWFIFGLLPVETRSTAAEHTEDAL